MEILQGIVPDSWLAWITLAVTICAAITTVLPAPKPEAGTLHKAVYALIQWVAFNLGKAKNEQDVKPVTLKNGR